MGFGEVAARFSAALVAGGAAVIAYDVLLDRPGGRETLATRAGGGGVAFVPKSELATADILLSTVTTDVALEAARAVTPHLRRGQIFVDLNATSPAIKREIAKTVSTSGALFVEGAILPAIGVMGARSKVLVCGSEAAATAAALTALGLNVIFYGEAIGRASSFKMLRSVFSKGLEALLIECRLAGRRAGVEDDLWQEIVATIDAASFAVVGGNWVRTHANANARRYHEMVQVEALLRALDFDPVMTAATVAVFDRSMRVALNDAFAGPPGDAAEVVAALDAKLAILSRTASLIKERP